MSLKGFGKAAVRVGLQELDMSDLLLNDTFIGPANLQAKIQYRMGHPSSLAHQSDSVCSGLTICTPTGREH